jgi:CheY-like chemotaxis protein
MDIQMPVMDGVECAKYMLNILHFNKDQSPIIGLTAGFQHSEKLYNENDVAMNSCLGKPLPMEALKKALARYQPQPPSVAWNVNTVNNLFPSSSSPQLMSKRKMDTSVNLTN